MKEVLETISVIRTRFFNQFDVAKSLGQVLRSTF